jgi:hypothetical protein
MFSEFKYISRMIKEKGKWVKQNIKAAAKEKLGYIAHRVGKEKEKMERTLFGHGGPLTEEQVERMIDEAPDNTYFFGLILSPDPNGENQERNLDLWKLTKDIVELLEQRLGRENLPFIGAEHNDHTDIPHVHALILIQRMGREMLIDRETIKAVYELATERALGQKQERQNVRELRPVQTQKRLFIPQLLDREIAVEPLDLVACGNCGNTQSPNTKDGWRKCLSCGEELTQGRGEGLSL